MSMTDNGEILPVPQPLPQSQGIDMAYINYLMNMQQTPALYGMDPGAVDEFGGFATDLRKAPSLAADQAFLISQPGLARPEDFMPVTRAEPVDAPGYRTLQQWSQGNPYQRLVAGMLAQGADSTSIARELQNLVDQGAEIAQFLPRQMIQDRPGGEYTLGEEPNLKMAVDQIQDLERMLMSDPQIDQQMSAEMGMPVAVTQEDSELLQKLQEMGYRPELGEIPGQGYTPALLDPGIEDRMAQAAAGEQDANRAYQEAMRRYQETRSRAFPGAPTVEDQMPMTAGAGDMSRAGSRRDVRDRFGSMAKPAGIMDALGALASPVAGAFGVNRMPGPESGPSRAAPTASPTAFSMENAIRALVGSTGAPMPERPQREAMTKFTMNRGGAQRAGRNLAQSKGVAQAMLSDRRKARGSAYQNQLKAADAGFAAEAQKRALADLAAEMAKRGRTPFDDRRNQINQAIYGQFTR
jgi:hypothetical protein